mgnify:CR=1 FL=1|tara:strand:- start:166 stop:555 length:390 start_codon:yes stop_codon:yes gene_type:complete
MLKNIEVMDKIKLALSLFFLSSGLAFSLPLKCTTPREAYTITFKQEMMSLFNLKNKLIGTTILTMAKQPIQIADKIMDGEKNYFIYLSSFAEEGDNYLEIKVKHNLKKVGVLYPLTCINKASLDHKIFF